MKPIPKEGKKRKKKGNEYKKNRKEMIDEMLAEKGYYYCQKTGVTNSIRYHCHHIIFRSEKPFHPFLHDKRNLIIIADEEHIPKAHTNKHEWRAELIKERNLTELFGNDILPIII